MCFSTGLTDMFSPDLYYRVVELYSPRDVLVHQILVMPKVSLKPGLAILLKLFMLSHVEAEGTLEWRAKAHGLEAQQQVFAYVCFVIACYCFGICNRRRADIST